MEKTLRIITQLKEHAVLKDYAIARAAASIFYIEPVLTYDLDIMLIPDDNRMTLVSLTPIYEWFKKREYELDKEHIIIEGVPVQFIPAYNELTEEAVKNALDRKFGDTNVKVIAPEYLIAIMIDTFRKKDRERVIRFLDEAKIDFELLNNILNRFDLMEKYNRIKN